MDFASINSKKVAGIPAGYLILAIAAIALFGALRLKKKPATDTTTPSATDPNSPDYTGASAPSNDQPVFTANPAPQVSGPVIATSNSPTTDDAWSRTAIPWLISQGYSVNDATAAIQNYLSGAQLSTVQNTAKDAAVKQFGLPPETLPASSVAPMPVTPAYSGPAAKQGTPPCTHTVRGTSDDSFGELARLYYGFTGSGSVTEIAAWNPGVREPIPVGTKVHIPKLTQPEYYRATSATRTVYAIARKNGTTPDKVQNLNPHLHFPVNAGTSVRVR